jgi:integrase
MRGGIYSDEKCPICEGKFRDYGNALSCPLHPKCRATRFVVRFSGITKRFKSYESAFRFLTGLRFKTDEETFDERDYRRDNPMSFKNMSDKWRAYKRDEVKRHSFRSIGNHLDKAQAYFGDKNVKDIRFGDLEDFIRSLASLSDKTRHNVLSTLHSFFTWMKKRQEIPAIPEFPEISYELGFRRTVDKDTQQKILAEIQRIAPDLKTYLGIKWLATYISVRPNEMRTLTTGNIDLENGYFYFPSPKEKKYKSVPIIPEDIEILASFPKSAPATPFFRNEASGLVFSQNHFYKWWKRACRNLGVEGVDLYGGTRHSSARALRAYFSPEEIKRATMHTSNAAFERYFRMESDDVRSIYRRSADVIKIDNADNALITKKGPF